MLAKCRYNFATKFEQTVTSSEMKTFEGVSYLCNGHMYQGIGGLIASTGMF